MTSHEFIALHENFHNLGVVDSRAPNISRSEEGHIDTFYTDIMYTVRDAGAPLAARRRAYPFSELDVNRQNYYNPAGLPNGLINIADSSFMISPRICDRRAEDCNPVVDAPAPILSIVPAPAFEPAPSSIVGPFQLPMPASASSPTYALAPSPELVAPRQNSTAVQKYFDSRLIATVIVGSAAVVAVGI